MPIFDPFKDDNEPRRRILKAGRRIFAEHGYDRASISMICKEADVNRAMISYYHGGKLALYRDIIEATVNTELGRVREGVYNVEGARDRLKTFIRLNVEFNITQPEIREILEREIGSNFANAGDMLGNYFLQIIAVLTDIVRYGMETGEFDKSLNTNDVSLTILGAMGMHFALNTFTKRIKIAPQIDRKQLGTVTEHICNFVLHGIAVEKK